MAPGQATCSGYSLVPNAAPQHSVLAESGPLGFVLCLGVIVRAVPVGPRRTPPQPRRLTAVRRRVSCQFAAVIPETRLPARHREDGRVAE